MSKRKTEDLSEATSSKRAKTVVGSELGDDFARYCEAYPYTVRVPSENSDHKEAAHNNTLGEALITINGDDLQLANPLPPASKGEIKKSQVQIDWKAILTYRNSLENNPSRIALNFANAYVRPSELERKEADEGKNAAKNKLAADALEAKEMDETHAKLEQDGKVDDAANAVSMVVQSQQALFKKMQKALLAAQLTLQCRVKLQKWIQCGLGPLVGRSSDTWQHKHEFGASPPAEICWLSNAAYVVDAKQKEAKYRHRSAAYSNVRIVVFGKYGLFVPFRIKYHFSAIYSDETEGEMVLEADQSASEDAELSQVDESLARIAWNKDWSGVVKLRRKAMLRVASVLGIDIKDNFSIEHLVALLFSIVTPDRGQIDTWAEFKKAHGRDTGDFRVKRKEFDDDEMSDPEFND